MRTREIVAALGLVVAGASAACADVVFDFENLRGNPNEAGGDYIALSVDAGGVYAVITRTSGERFTVWNSGGEEVPGTWGAKHLSPVFNFFMDDYLVMSFSEPLRSVAVEFGDYGQDDDLAELYAYSDIHGGGDLVGYASGQLGDMDMRWDAPVTLAFAAEPGEEIWSIRFRGGRNPFPQSTFIDNIAVRTAPSPGALTLLGLSLGAVSGRRRRRGR